MLSEFENVVNLWLNSAKKASEYELIKFIETEWPSFFANLPNPEELYQKHFWLFHHLYLLNNKLTKENSRLIISALEIRIVSNQKSSSELDVHDALAGFYLNKKNLNLSSSEVAEMQKVFWERYLALQNKADAIARLELTGVKPLTLTVVKKQFLKLSKIHHPDKGGDGLTFSKIKNAYNELKLLF